MKIFCDVYDAASNRLGDGPIAVLKDVAISKVLDGCGTIRFSTPAADERVLSLLTVLRRVRLHVELGDYTREIARGIILNREFSESSAGAEFRFTCADNLNELKYRNTYLGRYYRQHTIQSVVNALIALVPGWSATVEAFVASKIIDIRLDGASVLKALQDICAANGCHFRLGTGNVVEIGTFGQVNSGVRIINVETINAELYADDSLVFIDAIEKTDVGEGIVNRVVPLGGGDGNINAISLRRSTRTSPYTVLNIPAPNPGEPTIYYLQADSANITAYGVVEKVITFKGIAPISNAQADIVNAANVLYDAAAAYLARKSVLQETYSIQVKNLKLTLKPGEKVRVVYKGIARRNHQSVDYININEDFWVIRVDESVGLEGSNATLEISNVDLVPESIEGMIVSAVEEIALRNLKPATSIVCSPFVYTREIAPSFPAIVPVEITLAVRELIRLRIRLRTTPFRSTASPAEHRHMVAEYVGYSNLNPGAFYQARFALDPNLAQSTSALYLSAASNPGTDIYTYGSAPGLTYGITDDNQHPQQISVFVNGVNRTSALGGPFAMSNAPINVVLNEGLMTEYINTAGTFAQTHSIEFRAAAGRGRIEAIVELYEVIQAIAVS